MSAFCRDSYKPHASSQCLFVKKGGYQFMYLYFSLHKNFMFMVKSYLMRGYVFHNGKQYWKKQVMYEANCQGILPDVWPGDGSVCSYPVFLKRGCPALNILWFCHKNTTCRQQEILQEDKTLLQLSQKANGCIQGLSPFRIPTLWRVLVLDPSPRSSVVTQNETQSLLHTVSMIRINGIFLMSLVFWGFFTTEQQ